MVRKQWLLVVPAVGFALTGCVSQDKFTAMKLDRDAALERAQAAARDAEAAKRESELAKGNLNTVMSNSGNERGLLVNQTNQIADLKRQLDELNRQYQDAINRTGRVEVLPAPVNDALTQFAAANPSLVDFDSARGIVKFKSDLTFNTGSADLRPEARTAISRFAQILNSPTASQYELQVAGHTDSQRVSNAETIKKGHLDNWYLSSHRAIEVGQALQREGVKATRVAVVGYADQHPVASNATEDGRKQNRRVEVLILPSTVHGSPSGGEMTAGAQLNKDLPAPPTATGDGNRRPAGDLNKEGIGATDNRPVLNK